ncbi:50S ribosomal protein L11 methyltransferase [Alkaliphilus hydrothermalis]|uniref:Ribosomal protein L11 methyltransferase n=1 Tax=Alkaliphilus hydrothermalis TaxID=1482730 RepID=A0ABS2NP16_9FIRM|nr:50S ribosomal protein L11 methyltransferase [Alkaliphilus hydrothermalis]MBM7614659.1 ribosomal protein L11 methyltransferase [Alkaliphilus hydrothermalis]
MKWIEVSIKTTTEAVEAVSNILYNAGVSGVAIEDPNDFFQLNQDEKAWDYVDEAFLPPDFAEGAVVKAYLPASADLLDKIELIKELVAFLPSYGLDIGLGEVTTIEVNEEDWSTSWKQYYKPVKIGSKILIKPTWEDYQPKGDEIIIEMDPGMAFGTGTHETTMMCVMELEEHVKTNSRVFDIGCGSGILGIAAAKLGAEEVVAIDLDKVAVEVARRNVLENHVENVVIVEHGDLMEKISTKADVVVANIIADIIVRLAKDIKHFLKDDGIFISSGIILDKIEMVKEGLIENGLEILKVKEMGEWAVIVSKIKGGANE